MQPLDKLRVLVRKAGVLFAEAGIILEQEGLIRLLRRASALLSKNYFRYEKYYMFELGVDTLDNLKKADFMPKVSGPICREVSTREQADELESGGAYCHWRSFNWNDRVDNGVIAFCTFAENELAHVFWVATNNKAQESMGQLPLKVDFANGEYCTRNWTNPKFRRLGLARYTTFTGIELLRDRGMTRIRYVVLKSNIASLAAFDSFKPKKYGEARFTKLFGWKSWREKPIN